MKKWIAVLLAVLTALSLAACGSSAAPAAQETPVAAETPAPEAAPAVSPTEPAERSESAEEPTGSAPEAPAEPGPPAPAAASGGLVLELSQLSSTLVYSEVYAMIFEPEEYIGKTVKMNGLFTAYEAEDGRRYFTCLVADATACCTQGLEFELNDSYKFPDDYPSPGDDITVTGVFDTYQEESGGNTYTYLVLRNAELV